MDEISSPMNGLAKKIQLLNRLELEKTDKTIPFSYLINPDL